MASKNKSRNTRSRTTKPQASRGKSQTTSTAKVTTTSPANSSIEAKPSAQPVCQHKVAEAAYFLWLQRGGNEVVNWLEAEAMLVQQSSR